MTTSIRLLHNVFVISPSLFVNLIYSVLKQLQQMHIICSILKYLCSQYIVVNHAIVDGRKLVSCGNDGFLKIFDVNTGSEVFAKNSNNQLK